MTKPHLESLVVEFNRDILDIQPRPFNQVTDHEFLLTSVQLSEEIAEMEDARDEDNFVGVVDAVIDLIYFAYGALYKHGLSDDQINECFVAVHEANMAKVKGIKETRVVTDSDHPADAVKPDGWVAPEDRIAIILNLGT